MDTVHTLGCSFTNWLYPTWADYISQHTDLQVINLASTGQGNDTIKQNLYTVDSSDHVFIMFSGYDRYNYGIDDEWFRDHVGSNDLKIHKIKESLDNDRYLYFLNKVPLSGFVAGRYIEGKRYSNFHYYIKMLENIYDCQNYLKVKNIDYTFCLWQGFYNDVKEIRAIKQPRNNLEKIEKNNLYKKIYDSIDWSKFVEPITQGLWEHIASDKKLVEVQSTVDIHPSSLCHFSYFKTHIKPILDAKTKCKNNLALLEDKAYQISKYYKEYCNKFTQMPEFDKKIKNELMKKYYEY